MKTKSWAPRILACIICGIVAVGQIWAARVSPESAAVVANNFMNVRTTSAGAQKAPAKRMMLKTPAQAVENQYYVFQNAGGEGWVIVAANDVVRPVLAYSNTGSFDVDNMPSNVQYWMDEYNRQIQFEAANTVTTPADVQQVWDALRAGQPLMTATPVVAPLIQTNWDQTAPYFNMCPTSGAVHCLTGCVATCMAQVMNYWQWPETGTGSHRDTLNGFNAYADFSATTYDWANMLPYYTGNNDPKVNRDAVATLMYHCGVAVDMQYGTSGDGGSAALTIDYDGWVYSIYHRMTAERALKENFGYEPTSVKGYARNGGHGLKSWTDEDWIAMLKVELDAARPIMYAGVGGKTGHSFVCDGYDNEDRFHFNWGWGGLHDGYFEVDALNPGTGGSGSGEGTYNVDQDVIVGIQPLNSAHAIVTHATGCRLLLSAGQVKNNNGLTATIIPTDATYDLTSVNITLGSTPLVPGTDYTLSADSLLLTINASAITGDNTNKLTINVVWTKHRYTYSMLGEHCAEMEQSGMVHVDSALSLVIMPEDGYSLADEVCWDVEMGGKSLKYGTDFTYEATTGTFAIAALDGEIEILAYGGKPITWMLNDEEFASNMALSDKYTLPASKPGACTSGKVFVGWCKEAGYTSVDSMPELIDKGQAYSVDTLYALFATEEVSGGTAFNNTAGGEFLIAAKVGNTKYYATGLPENGVIMSSTDERDAKIYTFEKVSGGFAIRYSDSYIKYESPNSLVEASEPFKWEISKPTTGVGTWFLKAATGRGWVFQANSINNFACYGQSKSGNGLYNLEIEIGGNKTYKDITTECTGTQGFEDADCGCEKAALKEIRNGQLVIIRGDAVYTVTGARIK